MVASVGNVLPIGISKEKTIYAISGTIKISAGPEIESDNFPKVNLWLKRRMMIYQFYMAKRSLSMNLFRILLF